MKTINIYITMKDKKLLNEIKNKYHLSYSTIANIVIYPMYMILGDKLKTTMYEKENTYKSCIKPRQNQYNSKQYTNALKLFLRKDYKNYCNEKKFQEVQTIIYKEFDNTWDENWNGNREARSITRFIKKNPNYVRRLIEE